MFEQIISYITCYWKDYEETSQIYVYLQKFEDNIICALVADFSNAEIKIYFKLFILMVNVINNIYSKSSRK